MSSLRLHLSTFAFCVTFSSTACFADYVQYTIPNTNLAVLLSGRPTINPGGTATLRHPRGTLHFNARDIRILKAPTVENVYGIRRRELNRSETIEGHLELAEWALRHGMLEKAKSLLSEAWKVDPSGMRIKKLAGLMSYINRPVANDADLEKSVRRFVVGSDMQVSRSKHFALFHSRDPNRDPVTKKTRPEMRLELLETVYESFFLSFAFRGKFLRPPTKPLAVVLFKDHSDFLTMEKQLGFTVKQLAGFYHPKENVSIFYDSGTTPQFRALAEMNRYLDGAVSQAKRTRQPGVGELIRLTNTIKLLTDIQRESEDVSVVSHEVVHHLAANTGLFPREATPVRWVHEGLASYFESAKLAKWSGVGIVDRDRIAYYRLLQGDPVRGGMEFIVSDLGFVIETALGNQLPAYGQAWALTHFLLNRHFDKTMVYYQRLSELPNMDDKSLRERGLELVKVFDDVFGDRSTLESEWRTYMNGLRTDLERLADRR